MVLSWENSTVDFVINKSSHLHIGGIILDPSPSTDSGSAPHFYLFALLSYFLRIITLYSQVNIYSYIHIQMSSSFSLFSSQSLGCQPSLNHTRWQSHNHKQACTCMRLKQTHRSTHSPPSLMKVFGPAPCVNKMRWVVILRVGTLLINEEWNKITPRKRVIKWVIKHKLTPYSWLNS